MLYSGASLSIVNNVKSVNRPRVCSCNVTAPLCVGDPILVTIIWISVIIPHRSSFEDRCCSICRLLDLVYQARRSLCVAMLFFILVIFLIALVSPWSLPGLSLVSSYRPTVFYLWFSVKLPYCIPAYKSPCYYIVISILYVLWSSNLSLFCDQVTSRTFHSMILDGIVRQCFVNSLMPIKYYS